MSLAKKYVLKLEETLVTEILQRVREATSPQSVLHIWFIEPKSFSTSKLMIIPPNGVEVVSVVLLQGSFKQNKNFGNTTTTLTEEKQQHSKINHKQQTKTHPWEHGIHISMDI